jgi:hypothetical protein
MIWTSLALVALAAPQDQDPAARMLQLIHQVERRLMEIDQMLYRAGSGEAPVSRDVDSGLKQLLQATRDQSRAVRSDMDEILSLAQQQSNSSSSSSSSSSSGSSSGRSSGDPQQGQRPGEQGQKDRTQSAPPPGQQTPRDGDQERGQQPSDPGSQPRSPDGSENPGRNRPGAPGEDSAKAARQQPDDADRWGDLPVHVRDLFRAQGGADLPPRYRDWIDSYYRRLNRRP